jgi:hypothetical protein
LAVHEFVSCKKFPKESLYYTWLTEGWS